jgi:hypothetical protein
MTVARTGTMQDKRAFLRHDACHAGRIIFFDAPCFVQCIIRNISADGALICMQMSIDLPREVLLWEEATGKYHECSVMWRNDRTVGLHFTNGCGGVEEGALLRRELLSVARDEAASSSVH